MFVKPAHQLLLSTALSPSLARAPGRTSHLAFPIALRTNPWFRRRPVSVPTSSQAISPASSQLRTASYIPLRPTHSPIPRAWPPHHEQPLLHTLPGPSMGQVLTPPALEIACPRLMGALLCALGSWAHLFVPRRTLMPLRDPEFTFCLIPHQPLKVSGLDLLSLNP